MAAAVQQDSCCQTSDSCHPDSSLSTQSPFSLLSAFSSNNNHINNCKLLVVYWLTNISVGSASCKCDTAALFTLLDLLRNVLVFYACWKIRLQVETFFWCKHWHWWLFLNISSCYTYSSFSDLITPWTRAGNDKKKEHH